MAVAQNNIPVAINMYEERAELRSVSSTILILIYIVGGILLAANPANWDYGSRNAWMMWAIFVVFGVLAFAVKISHPSLSNLLLVSAPSVSVAFYLLFVTHNPLAIYINLLTIALSLMFMRTEHVPKVVATAIFLVIIVDTIVHGRLWITHNTIFFSTIAFAFGMAAYTLLQSMEDIAQWALDSQNKNFVRAESFYEQGEKLRKATYDLARAKEHIEEVSQAKSTFLSNMSHELRTPLNMVIGYTSSMLNMPQMYNHEHLPEIFRKDIELVQSSGEYLLTLINDILDLSKIESGKFEIAQTAFDPVPILQGVMATAIGLVKDKPLQLKPDFPDDLPLLWGDPVRIRQILLNLMSNGVKYTESGSVTLSVHQQGDKVKIAVIDTGVGIPENTIATIFDRFEQVQQNSNIQGTGLGLDISQRLAEMHNSRITIESKVGIGSIFTFDLALATVEQQVSYNDTDTMHTLSGIKRFEEVESDWSVKHTVLIAEDESNTRSMLRRSFEASNFIVFEEQDGNEVYDTASAILPNLIILDIMLPNKDGWAVLDELKNDPETASIPVIVLSAHIDKVSYDPNKADLYLVKPIDNKKIIEHANQVMARKAEKQEY